jgi:hypothetical protein
MNVSNNYPDWIKTEQDLAALYWRLHSNIIFEQDAASSDYATSFCTDCPMRDDGREYNCCKHNGGWEEANAEGEAWLNRMIALREAIKAVVTPQYLEAAQPGKVKP